MPSFNLVPEKLIKVMMDLLCKIPTECKIKLRMLRDQKDSSLEILDCLPPNPDKFYSCTKFHRQSLFR